MHVYVCEMYVLLEPPSMRTKSEIGASAMCRGRREFDQRMGASSSTTGGQV